VIKRFTLTAENKEQVIPLIGQYLRNLDCTKPQSVVISDNKETRRSQQNRLYWKWVSIIGNELGYERQEMHDTLVFRLLGMVDKVILGKPVCMLASTHDMSVADFSDYMERVSRFAAEMNIKLPAEDI